MSDMAAREEQRGSSSRRSPLEAGSDRLPAATPDRTPALEQKPLSELVQDFHDQVRRCLVVPQGGGIPPQDSPAAPSLPEGVESAIVQVERGAVSGRITEIAGVVAAIRRNVLQNTEVSEVVKQAVDESGRTVFGSEAWYRDIQTAVGKRFIILEEIGRGGMGAVYRAQDQRLWREVAIKVMMLDPEDRVNYERFVKEGQTQASLQGQWFPSIYDADERGGIAYVVMELIPGMNARHLRNIADKAKRECERLGVSFPMLLWQTVVLILMRPVIEGIQYLHEREIDHRDIKLSNIMLSQEGEAALGAFLDALKGLQPNEDELKNHVMSIFKQLLAHIRESEINTKLLDFGLAKHRMQPLGAQTLSRTQRAPRGGTPQTEAGTKVGTPGYMPPEVLGGKASFRADFYALGICLFEALTGIRLSEQHLELSPLVAKAIVADGERKRLQSGQSPSPSSPPLSLVAFVPEELQIIREASPKLADLLERLTAITTDPMLLLGSETVLNVQDSILEVVDSLLPNEVREAIAAQERASHSMKVWQKIAAIVGIAAGAFGALSFLGVSKANVAAKQGKNEAFRIQFEFANKQGIDRRLELLNGLRNTLRGKSDAALLMQIEQALHDAARAKLQYELSRAKALLERIAKGEPVAVAEIQYMARTLNETATTGGTDPESSKLAEAAMRVRNLLVQAAQTVGQKKPTRASKPR